MAPGAAATEVSVTVAVEVWLPVSTAGAKDIELICGASTVNVAETVLFAEALMVTCDAEFTGFVRIVNTAVVWPDGTVTLVDDSSAIAELLLASLTSTPPRGAAVAMVTVALTVLPPATCSGERARLTTFECPRVAASSELFAMRGH